MGPAPSKPQKVALDVPPYAFSLQVNETPACGGKTVSDDYVIVSHGHCLPALGPWGNAQFPHPLMETPVPTALDCCRKQ